MQEAAPGPVSVVLFISNGASFETSNMAGYWARGERDGAPWSDRPVRLGRTTYPLNTSTTPTMDDTPMVGHDRALAWSAEPVDPDTTPFPPTMPGRPSMVHCPLVRATDQCRETLAGMSRNCHWASLVAARRHKQERAQ